MSEHALSTIIRADATVGELRSAAAALRGEPLSVFARGDFQDDDVDVIQAIAGMVPLHLTDDSTAIVLHLPSRCAVYARVEGVFPLDAIRDAIVRGRGTAADAPIIEIAVTGGAS